MNWSLGFGLEKIGLLVLRFPRAATLFLLASIIMAAAAIPRIGFDGNVVNVLDSESRAFKNFIAQATKFHDFSGDVAVILKNKDLEEVETFEGLRNLHLDLTLEDGIESVFSIFTLGEASASADGAESLLPAEFTSSEQVKKSLAQLLNEEPSAGSIIAPQEGAMMLMVRLQRSVNVTENALAARMQQLRGQLEKLAPPGTQFFFSGMPQIRVSIVEAIISDQTVLSVSGVILGCLVAWFIFGSFRAAIICTIPAFAAIIWILGGFAATGNKLNFFTTALPTLALIIAFADTIVLYFRWQALQGAQSDRALESLKQAIRTVGPASSLTSITTALAFGSFAWAASETMDELAVFGIMAVSFAFLGVIIGLPVACYWSIRYSGNNNQAVGPKFTGHGAKIAHFATAAPKLVLTVAMGSLVLFAYAHYQIRPSYSISDYLPYNSEIRKSEAFADEVFGGTSQYYVLVPVTEGGAFNDEENRLRLTKVHDAVASVFGVESTQSLASAWKRLTQNQIDDFPLALEEASQSVTSRFIAKDRRILQVAATTSAGESTFTVETSIGKLQSQLNKLPFAGELSITGLTVLLAQEFPKLIGELRTGLLVSIFLAVIVVAVATRNPALAAASLLPNLVPILFTETVMWMIGASLSVSNVIALTIAFGIAIDNAVHVINAYDKMRGRGLDVTARVQAAVTEIAPALLASTGIISVAAIITQLSSMPSVAELGVLLIATLIVALISNLVILPAAMIVILTWKGADDSVPTGPGGTVT